MKYIALSILMLGGLIALLVWNYNDMQEYHRQQREEQIKLIKEHCPCSIELQNVQGSDTTDAP